MEDRKISRTLSTAVRQTEKISGEGSGKKNSDSSLYYEKIKFFFYNEKSVKITNDLMLVKVTQVLIVSKF